MSWSSWECPLHSPQNLFSILGHISWGWPFLALEDSWKNPSPLLQCSSLIRKFDYGDVWEFGLPFFLCGFPPACPPSGVWLLKVGFGGQVGREQGIFHTFLTPLSWSAAQNFTRAGQTSSGGEKMGSDLSRWVGNHAFLLPGICLYF